MEMLLQTLLKSNSPHDLFQSSSRSVTKLKLLTFDELECFLWFVSFCIEFFLIVYMATVRGIQAIFLFKLMFK